MKKLAILFILSLPAWCAADHLGDQLIRATAHAFAKSTVQVHIQLAKPVYMSDVMFRRPRGKNVVIYTDYKEQTCTGRLSAQATHVSVPLSCVQDDKYKAEKISLTFADGRRINKTAQALHVHEKSAHIVL